jgi:outer membrane protein TolC
MNPTTDAASTEPAPPYLGQDHRAKGKCRRPDKIFDSPDATVGPRIGLGLGLAATALLLAMPSSAQRGAARPAVPAPAAPAPAATAAPSAAPSAAEAPPMGPTVVPSLKTDPLADALKPSPGGLDPQRVAELAVRSSHAVAGKQAELHSAAAKVDQALVAYFPIVTTGFTYTRLSPVDNSIDIGITIPGMGSSISFPTIVNSYSFDTQIAVPFSDYLLRLTQAYGAASAGEEAKRLETRATALQAAADAKVAFLNWIRAKGTRAVAELAVEQTRGHLKDAKLTVEAQMLSRADYLRLVSQLAQAEQLAQSLRNFEAVAEEQLRLSVHLDPHKPLASGIDVLQVPGELETRPLPELQRLALSQRVELKALDAGRRAAEQAEWLAFAGYFPRLDGFAQFTYANPNQRVFASEAKWDFTWALGFKLGWTVNETFTTIGRQAEAAGAGEAIDAQREVLSDGIKLSVAAAYRELQTARSAITAAERSEEAATEGLRVRREVFLAGRATSTDIIDAETELTRARLSRVNAHVDVLVAQAKLAYAVGLDTLPKQVTVE